CMVFTPPCGVIAPALRRGYARWRHRSSVSSLIFPGGGLRGSRQLADQAGQVRPVAGAGPGEHVRYVPLEVLRERNSVLAISGLLLPAATRTATCRSLALS